MIDLTTTARPSPLQSVLPEVHVPCVEMLRIDYTELLRIRNYENVHLRFESQPHTGTEAVQAYCHRQVVLDGGSMAVHGGGKRNQPWKVTNPPPPHMPPSTLKPSPKASDENRLLHFRDAAHLRRRRAPAARAAKAVADSSPCNLFDRRQKRETETRQTAEEIGLTGEVSQASCSACRGVLAASGGRDDCRRSPCFSSRHFRPARVPSPDASLSLSGLRCPSIGVYLFLLKLPGEEDEGDEGRVSPASDFIRMSKQPVPNRL
ncbi:hypothetical protein LXL04_002127 [Taraxacum kok-saghyz]